MDYLPKNIERLNKIVEILESKGKVEIAQLSQLFKVTNMTIYRDLKILEIENKLILTRGGAQFINNKPSIEYPNYFALTKNLREKEALAKSAISFIKNNETIFLDGSTTVLTLAKLIALQNINKITVVTSSPIIATELSRNNNIQVLCSGGILNNTNFVFYSSNLNYYFSDINLTKAFMSCSGFSIIHGFTETIRDEAILKKAIIKNCPEINILADHSKYNITFTYTFTNFDRVKRLIVDDGLNDEVLRKLKKTKTEIITG
jgi:DeoR/GlpR family transcriptional regulator of sugar metabolism